MNAAIPTRNNKPAFQLFDAIKEADIEPTVVSYTTLIEAAISIDDTIKAVQIY